MARLGFDANEIAPDSGGGPIPPGEYEFQVIEEAVEQSASGKGTVLKLIYEVIGGDFSGRKMWVNMNIAHDNPVAQKIGQAELSALCHATGQMFVEDSEELLWKPFLAVTKIEVDKGNGKERAAVKKYIFGGEPTPPANKAPPQRPAPAPQRQAAPQQRQQAPSRPAVGAAQGGRALPWQGRQQQQQPAAAELDEDIPF